MRHIIDLLRSGPWQMILLAGGGIVFLMWHSGSIRSMLEQENSRILHVLQQQETRLTDFRAGLLAELRKDLDLSPGQMNRGRRDALRARRLAALADTAAYVRRAMRKAPVFNHRFALLKWALENTDAKLSGLYLEFGVAKGASINHIASLTDKEVHGFDSFEGNPEAWNGLPAGTFKTDKLPDVRKNVLLHKGWFSDSLPVFRREHDGPVAFAHMDADLYSSSKTVFDILADRIVPGTVFVFDEYFNYPGWQRDGEYKAFQEFVKQRAVRYEYIGYVAYDEQAAVKIISIGK